MIYLNEMETSELIIQLKKKSPAAFSDLYDSYSAALYGVACRMVRDRDVAKELLQDSFVKIWEHFDRYDPAKGTLFTWMLNITSNTCKDYFRSKRYHYRMLVAENGLDQVDVTYSMTYVTYQDDNQDLYQLTQNLESKYKEIIDLVYIFGYSQEEVSKMLKIPLGTVKTRSRNALKILRDLYN